MASYLYGTGCRHTTICGSCGKAMVHALLRLGHQFLLTPPNRRWRRRRRSKQPAAAATVADGFGYFYIFGFGFRVGAGGEDASNGKSAVGDRQIEAKPDTLTVDTGAGVPFHQIF
ncbi:uncharacterized protein [Lolium perenne]